MNQSPSRILIGAAAAFTVALFLFGSALLRAFSAGDVLLPPPAAPAAPSTEGGEADRGLTTDALQLAVESDPFSPTRERAPQRYRLPGDVDPEPEPTAPAPPPPPAFTVTGTVISESGSYALIGVGDAAPRMLRVGDRSLGYALTNVTPETATMSNAENTIMLNVPAPAHSVAQAPQGRPGTTRPGQPAARAGDVMQQMIERARASGMDPAVMERMLRAVEGIDPRAIEALEITPNGFNVRANGGNLMLRGGQVETPRGGATPQAAPQPRSPLPFIVRPRPDTTELRMQRAPDFR